MNDDLICQGEKCLSFYVAIPLSFVFLGGIVITAFCCAAFIWYYCKVRKLRRTGAAGVSEDRTALFSSSAPDKQIRMGMHSTLSGLMPQFPTIPLEIFVDHVQELRETGGFTQEYRHLDGITSSQPVTVARTTENNSKNRYRNISPYDHTRVILKPTTPRGSPQQNDYINANYLNGYSRSSEYIAAQGPLTTTVEDFWRMVWGEGTAIIVMVTNLYEMGRPKCAPYWPETEQAVRYGDLSVQPLEVTVLPTYILRRFTLLNVSSGARRPLVQYHFTTWPDFGVPLLPSDMLHFIRVIRGEMMEEHGPLLIHCSAGVGRTGTYMAIDVLLQHIEDHPGVSVQGVVQDLRSQRMKMVQSEEQYEFIYRAVAEAYLYKCTLVQGEGLRSYLDNLLANEGLELTNEFLRLPSDDPGAQYTVALSKKNREKNRDFHRLPLDNCRLCVGASDEYINATPLLGFSRELSYVITQHPLPDTCADFWRMVLHLNCSSIAIVGSMQNEQDYYWSQSNHGTVTVVMETTTNLGSFQEISVVVSCEQDDYEPRSVKIYHFHKWDNSNLVAMVTDWLRFMDAVDNDGDAPVIVHASPSLSQDDVCGVFCGLASCQSQLQQEGCLDLFQTVREVRAQRPSALVSKDHYLFLYRCLLKWTTSQDSP